MAAPIEAKVQAAGVAGAAAGVVLWVLQTYAFKGGSVPAGLVSLVDVAVPGVLALAGGYLPGAGRRQRHGQAPGRHVMARTAAGFAAGVLAALAIQHLVFFHLQRIYRRRFRSSP